MVRRLLTVGALTLITGLSLNIASGSEAKKGPPTIVITETATSRFYGPGPANLGLDVFNVDTVVTGTRTTTNDATGTHIENAWFDQFTLYDMISGEAVLSCSASGQLPADSVGVANDQGPSRLGALNQRPATRK